MSTATLPARDETTARWLRYRQQYESAEGPIVVSIGIAYLSAAALVLLQLFGFYKSCSWQLDSIASVVGRLTQATVDFAGPSPLVLALGLAAAAFAVDLAGGHLGRMINRHLADYDRTERERLGASPYMGPAVTLADVLWSALEPVRAGSAALGKQIVWQLRDPNPLRGANLAGFHAFRRRFLLRRHHSTLLVRNDAVDGQNVRLAIDAWQKGYDVTTVWTSPLLPAEAACVAAAEKVRELIPAFERALLTGELPKEWKGPSLWRVLRNVFAKPGPRATAMTTGIAGLVAMAVLLSALVLLGSERDERAAEGFLHLSFAGCAVCFSAFGFAGLSGRDEEGSIRRHAIAAGVMALVALTLVAAGLWNIGGAGMARTSQCTTASESPSAAK